MLFLAAVGGIALAYYARSLLCLARQVLCPPRTHYKKYLTAAVSLAKEVTTFVLISGASDGIGKAFAFAYADLGFNLLLVSRSADKLQAVAADILAKHPDAVVETVPFDFARADKAQWASLEKVVRRLPISILVNNVAINVPMPTPFGEIEPALLDDMVQVNLTTMFRLTSFCLPGMQERRRGLIINISSFAALSSAPFLGPYAGLKAALGTWSEALHAEYKASGIHVSVPAAYFVTSAMSKIRRASFMVPTPATWVRAVVRSADQYTAWSPVFSHALMRWGVDYLVPKGLLVSYTAGLNAGIRKRALRKLERESKNE